MARGPLLFRQSDVARAFRAAQEAGLKVRVDISKEGKLSIVPLSDPPGTQQGKVEPEPEREIVL